MSKLTGLALSIAVLGGVWAFLALGPLAGYVLVWAGFIAWGCYFALGADTAALQKTIAGMIYGAVIAGIALALVGANPLGLPGATGPAVYIAVTVFLLVIIAFCCASQCIWLCSNCSLCLANYWRRQPYCNGYDQPCVIGGRISSARCGFRYDFR